MPLETLLNRNEDYMEILINIALCFMGFLILVIWGLLLLEMIRGE